ncbi:MAG: two-component regulator propeller domain-containing protein, partial [Bacteroidota bacterium]
MLPIHFRKLLIVLSLLWGQQLVGQTYTYHVRTFGLEDGLMHRRVNCVFEDDDGFMWIGFEKGFQRFDGYDFKTWTRALDHPDLENITNISQDDEGWLWLWNHTAKHFVFFHPATETFQSQDERFGASFPIRTNASQTSGWTTPLRNILRNSEGSLVFISSQPSEIISYRSGQFTHIPIPELEANFLELYFLDSKDQLWITDHITHSNLYKVDLAGNILQSWSFPDNYDISDFFEQQDTVFFQIIYDDSTLDELQYTAHYIVNEEHQKVEDYKGSYKSWKLGPWNWTLIDDHLHLNKGGVNTPSVSIPADKSLKDHFSYQQQMLADSRGKFWLASRLGLVVFSIEEEKFQRYFSFAETDEKPISNAARGMVTQGDKLYANFEYGGLVEFDLTSPETYRFLLKDHQYEGRPILIDGTQLTIGHHENLLELSTETFALPTATILKEHNLIWYLWTDAQKGIWAGGRTGLIYISHDRSTWEVIAAP